MRADVPSMGPRPSSRGYDALNLRVPPGVNLQWGRDLVVADTKGIENTAKEGATLQWGRDLVVADTL